MNKRRAPGSVRASLGLLTILFTAGGHTWIEVVIRIVSLILLIWGIYDLAKHRPDLAE